MNPLETEQLIYDFALYIYPILNNWPKAEKFALTNRIKNCIFTMLEECVALRKSSTKKSHAYAIDRELDMLRTYFHLGYDLKYCNAHRAALNLADEALALAERKDSCTGGQRRALADLEFEYAIGIFQTTNPEMEVKNNATFQR